MEENEIKNIIFEKLNNLSEELRKESDNKMNAQAKDLKNMILKIESTFQLFREQFDIHSINSSFLSKADGKETKNSFEELISNLNRMESFKIKTEEEVQLLKVLLFRNALKS